MLSATWPALLASLLGGSGPDSTTVTLRIGADNPELRVLMSRVLNVEKLHFELHDPRLAGKRFHLTYQEFRDGVATAEKDTAPDALTRFDAQGNFVFDAFARQAGETTVENKFLFARGMSVRTYEAVAKRGKDYSLRPDIWPYRPVPGTPAAADNPTTTRRFPVGKKIPLLVYTLPYESDGFLQYCTVAQSRLAPPEWYAKYRIPHYVVYQLVIE